MFKVILQTTAGLMKVEANVTVGPNAQIEAISLTKVTTLDGDAVTPIGKLKEDIVNQIHNLALEAQYFQEFERGVDNMLAKYDDIS